ncbi:hypothetical protein ACIRQF_00075 [Streptomyces sp. NPDC101191]
MKNYRVQWTQDGREHESRAGYDQPSAEARKTRPEKQGGVTDVKVVPATP